jgi:tetraprenyl-beta-curcumene synthase
MKEATAISDPELRRIALRSLAEERGNLNGAGIFAVYLSGRYRAVVVDALVTFQAIFDYADTLAEHEALDPVANARALHEALLDALVPRHGSSDYYAHRGGGDDAGYLLGLVCRCRAAVASLPSYATVEKPLGRVVHRMVEYQTLIHGGGAFAPTALAGWAREEAPPGIDLRWWETAAAGASSLVAFALIAAAANPTLTVREVEAIEAAYFPWYGALHVLLDSLVDLSQDAESGHHSLVENYSSPEETARRMEAIGSAAVRSARTLPHAHQHALFLASMAGYYLAKPSARLPHAAETTRRLIAVLGDLAWPVMLVQRARRRVGSALDRN